MNPLRASISHSRIVLLLSDCRDHVRFAPTKHQETALPGAEYWQVSELFHASRRYFKGDAKLLLAEQQTNLNQQFNRPDMNNPKNDKIHIWAMLSPLESLQAVTLLPGIEHVLAVQRYHDLLEAHAELLRHPNEVSFDLLTKWKETPAGLVVESTFACGITKPKVLPLPLVKAINTVLCQVSARGQGPEAMAEAFIRHNVEEFGNLPQFLPVLYRQATRKSSKGP